MYKRYYGKKTVSDRASPRTDLDEPRWATRLIHDKRLTSAYFRLQACITICAIQGSKATIAYPMGPTL